MVPHDVERPSACPACGEGVPRDSYDCVYEGCIRPACRLVAIPLGGRKRPFDWRTLIHRISLVIVLVAFIYILYMLLVGGEIGAGFSTWQLAGAGMTLVVMAFIASATVH
jgi:hypothetical protein